MVDVVKVKFPKKVVDYWLDNPLTWEKSRRNVECYVCTEPITIGDEYFEHKVADDDIQRGHLYHLEIAEPVEWIPRDLKE